MPYLENEEKKNNSNNMEEEVLVPNITGLSIETAKKVLSELELELKVDEEGLDEKNVTIKEQIPCENIKVNKNTKIIIKY